MDRRSFIGGAASLYALAACGHAPPDDRLELSAVTLNTGIDPYKGTFFDTADLSWLYADGLVGTDLRNPHAASLSAQPPRAVSLSSGASNTSFHYVLRSGIRWHDGAPFTANDVRTCLTRLQTTPWAFYRPYRLIERLDIHGPLSFTVTLSQPDADFPAAFFSPLGAPGLPLVRAADVPLGTGPFRVAAHDAERCTYAAWRGSPRGTPQVARARLQFLSDLQTQDLELRSGATDVAIGADQRYVRTHGIGYVRRTYGVGYVLLNVRGALANARLRQAAAQAIDRDAIVRTIYVGWAPAMRTILPPHSPGSAVLAPPYDPQAARAVFAAHPRLTLRIATVAGNAERLALVVQAQLRRVGVRSQIHRYADAEYAAPDGPLRGGDFDLALWGESFSLDPNLLATWGCAARSPHGNNFARFCDPAFDADVRAGRMTRAMRRFWQDVPAIPLAAFVTCVAYGKRVRGVRPPADLGPSVYDCTQWSLR